MKKLNNKVTSKIYGGRICYCITPDGEQFNNGPADSIRECTDSCHAYGRDFRGTFDLYEQNNQVEFLARQ